MKLNRKIIILIMLTLAQLLVRLDNAIVNLALPAIKGNLHFDDASLQWVLTVYVLTFGGFLMIGGRVADLYGRRRVLLLGMAGFTLSSLLIGFSQSSLMLIVMRGIEGIGAAFMAPTALSILLTTFREDGERNWALSAWSLVAAAGAALGVVLGGLLTQYLGWRWNFFINVPIGLLGIAGTLRWVPAHSQEAQNKQLDLPGAVLVTGGLMTLVYALTLAPRLGWESSATLVSLGVSLVLLAAFLINETRVQHPLVPLSIFRIREVSGGNLIMIPIVGSGLGAFYFSSLYIQNVLHYSPALSGISFLPVPIVIGVIATRAPRLLSRFGFKPMLVVGTILLGLGAFLMSLVRANSSYLVNILPAFLIFGIGNGLATVAGTVAATTGVRGEEAGLASGLINTSQQVGGALGLAVLAEAASSVTGSGLTAGQNLAQASLHGYQEAFLVAAVLLAVALLISVFVIRAPENELESDCPDTSAV